MSYLALARKWRPSQFDQVVGQSHVLTALENALAQNKLHHAYLFSGTRGVGKTSIGRLFAKGLNCEIGITAKPCGQCGTCKEIDEGRFVDLLEIDAASRTKVEDTRELLDNVQYKPARGRFKVYLIDEVHMLSRHSFNALLKTLEEPPEYVKFLLATTDPQKLPVTILSRCLQFHLKPINADTIHEQLNTILKKEQVATEHRALGLISHAADGSMRDALSLADQAIALGNGTVSTETVSVMLGTMDTDQAIQLLEAMASKQVENAMALVQRLAENGIEWDGLLQELASQLHRIAMYQALPSTLDQSKPDAEKIKYIGKNLTPQDVQLYYQIALKGRQDLPYAPTARMGLEMTVLRMMAFHPTKENVATAIQLPTSQPESADLLAKQSHVTKPNQQASTNMPLTERVSPVASSPVTARSSSSSSLISSAQTNNRHKAQLNEQPPMPLEHDYPSAPDEYDANDYVPAEMQQVVEPNVAGQVRPQGYDKRQASSVQQESAPNHSSPQTSKSPLVGLRHQLRSKRASTSSTKSATENNGKKPKATSNTSAIERVTQQHAKSATSPVPSKKVEKNNNAEMVTTQGADNHSAVEQGFVESNNEPYQWKSTAPHSATEEKSELTPTQIKRALEHTKTPEMMEQLVRESVARDEWSALIQQLDVSKLVEQLALNSFYEKRGSTIVLHVRPSHAHLNKDRAQSELLQALNSLLGEECSLTVEQSDKGQTPLEIREAIYQEKLTVAHQILQQDKNVQFIQTRFSAEIDLDSVRPI
ncbi:DNA polymerase III subunit gamma/tau [Vibrio sp. TH_r3]|uniref:DNA polymerase III subunit gamma/tau n=1 Tax=Vibrio sp. TH_r3 TaxID=3082084 RepID=UPI00295474B1|nr:DNA polymerase III subunit gamma/tau [Vibrio sp. TH_r3]MDV7103157.1 DNA polymerase III subunit gamma/tau [Vibrio sp. TH_r3]